METTEKIVECYVRYVRNWATIPNIRCKGQLEIDLLAVDPLTCNRYHIETSVSTSSAFSRLRVTPDDPEALKLPVKKAIARRTLGYFIERKFDQDTVIERLHKFGFAPGNYTKVIVTWGWTKQAREEADKAQIVLWDFRDIITKISVAMSKERSYFMDDTLRTLNLFVLAKGDQRLTS